MTYFFLPNKDKSIPIWGWHAQPMFDGLDLATYELWVAEATTQAFTPSGRISYYSNLLAAPSGPSLLNEKPLAAATNYSLTAASTVIEGNTLTFTITRSGSTPSETVYFSTLSGTATFGEGDYATTAGGSPSNIAVNFALGATSRTVTINILNDGVADSGETFRAIVQRNTSDPITTYLAATGNITINDAPIATTYSISASSTVVEGNTLTFTITRSGSMPSETVYFSTVGGTATFAEGDYATTSGAAPENIAVSFSSGATSRTVTINILNDGFADSGERFTGIVQRNASDPVITYLAATGNITINDAPIASTYSIDAASTVIEGNTLTFTITRSGSSPSETVYFSTLSGTATYSEGDYATTAGGSPSNIAVSFASGATSRTVSINILDDSVADSGETFRAIVQRNTSDPVTTYLAATGNITINDGAAAADDYADDFTDNTAAIGQLNVGVSVSGRIELADGNDNFGDKDVFAVNLVGGQTYRFQMTSQPVSGSPALPLGIFTVRSSDFTTILETSEVGNNVSEVFSPTQSGTYYVRVGTGGAATDQGGYRLAVANITQAAAADDYPDDPAETGTIYALPQIVAGRSRLGTLEAAGDKDTFSISTINGNRYQISVTGEDHASSAAALQSIFVSLRDGVAFGSVLRTSEGTNQTTLTFTASGGTEFIRVGSGGSGSSVGGYRVSFADLGPAPAPVSPPTVVPGQTAAEQVTVWIDKAAQEFSNGHYEYFFRDETWRSLKLASFYLKNSDLNTIAYKLSGFAKLLGNAITIAEAVDEIVESGNFGRGLSVVVADLVAGWAFSSGGGLALAGIGTALGGPLGGILGGIAGGFGGSVVYTWFLQSRVRAEAGEWYDAASQAEIIALNGALDLAAFHTANSSTANAIEPDGVVVFDEQYYFATYADAAAAVALGMAGSALTHYLTIGIDLGYRPNAAQLLTRADLAWQVVDNNPLALGNSALFTQQLGQLAGDGQSAAEGQLLTAINSLRGATTALEIDAGLTAIAHRKALDLIANGPGDITGQAFSALNSDWAQNWTNNNVFVQQFTAHLERLLGAEFPSMNLQLLAAAASETDAASVLQRLLEKAGSNGLSEGRFDSIGIAEVGGIWIVILADRTPSAVTSTPGADTLQSTTQFGSSAADVMLSGTRNAYLHGGEGSDFLNGGSGNDWLYGDAGNDLLVGNGGANAYFGGDGDDHIRVDSTALISNVDGGAGLDRLNVTDAVSLGSIVSIEAIEFAAGANLTLTGAQFANGLAANTTLAGTGTLTVNMTSGVNFSASSMSFTNTVATVVNGTSGIDIIKLGLGASTGNIVNSGDGVDQIRGSQGVDTINGGNGNDKIMALGGADILTGGAGNDQFRFFSQSDSGLGAAADRITDFTIDGDRLNFVLIDADAATAGDQAFSFVGTAAFTNTGVGQIRYTTSGADLLVQADVNGDGVADMEIILQGRGGGTLTATDFIL